MRRRKHSLPVPQHEFGFAPAAFNLVLEVTLDGERVARERTRAEEARRLAEQSQARLFAVEEVAHY